MGQLESVSLYAFPVCLPCMPLVKSVPKARSFVPNLRSKQKNGRVHQIAVYDPLVRRLKRKQPEHNGPRQVNGLTCTRYFKAVWVRRRNLDGTDERNAPMKRWKNCMRSRTNSNCHGAYKAVSTEIPKLWTPGHPNNDKLKPKTCFPHGELRFLGHLNVCRTVWPILIPTVHIKESTAFPNPIPFWSKEWDASGMELLGQEVRLLYCRGDIIMTIGYRW